MVGLVSGAGLVGLLSEPDTELQVFALRAANESISLLWMELANAVGEIEALYENESFPERELAALVAAKIYYHLQEYDESMIFALAAGKLFNIEQEGEFEDTIIAKCIDTYVTISVKEHPPSQSATLDAPAFSANTDGSASTSAALASPITPFSQSALPSKSLLSRDEPPAQDSSFLGGSNGAAPGLQKRTRQSLDNVISRIFERCFQEGAYRHVVGIAVEARNLDILREAIKRAGNDTGKSGKSKSQEKGAHHDDLMEYLLDICMNVIQEREFKNEILSVILNLLTGDEIGSPDYFSIAKCIVYLDAYPRASDLLRQLVERDEGKSLAVAYQISFDLYDNGTQEFLGRVIDGLPTSGEESSEFSSANEAAKQADSSDAQLLAELENRSGAPTTSTIVSRTKASNVTDEHKKAYNSIREILQGSKSLELNLEFLFRSNNADHNILNKLKTSLEARNSIFHSAVTFANAFMNSGTTSDWFIRENLDWLGKAINWSKFSVTASLGVIHRGNIGQGQKLLEPYLKESNPAGSGSAYSKGGALFALGLIYTNHGKHVSGYLFDQLQKAQSEEIVQHGAALGLGVAGMASNAEHIVDELKAALFSDSAISGQATGLAMGLVLLGSGNVKALEDMTAYAHETEHDKTIRGLALGMALIMYARQEAADGLINVLLDDADPTLRYGGIMTVALAYCGTSSNKAVRKLLHVAVSDVNDDVRRAAVLSLGFVLFRKPESVPRMVELLAESYNPHVRYGATMALGIACAGTGLEEAVDLLEPMMKDSTDFVRQGAFIALAMIMVQQTEAMNPKVVTIRKHLQKVIGDRHEDAMAKFGAAIALGIIDAGGRNCTIGLQTQSGNLNLTAIIGMAVFTQYWYWFPLTHFLSLAFTPTSVIGLDQELEVPDFKMHCNARASMYEYPPSVEVKAEEAPEKVKTAVLSTTAQARRRKMAKDRQQKPDGMDVDQPPSTPKLTAVDDDQMDLDEDAKKSDDSKAVNGDMTPGKAAKAKLEKEKVGFEVENISRVLPAQLKHLSFSEGRYVPVRKPTGGVILLTDMQPSEAKTLIERKVKKAVPRKAPDVTDANPSGASITPLTPRPRNGDDVAAVLNSIDEDVEGGEEATVPDEFEYLTDAEPEE